MKITFNTALKIIKSYYGEANVIQIRKPDSKNFYIVDFKNGASTHLTRDEIEKLK